MTSRYENCSDEVKAELEGIDGDLAQPLPADWSELHAELVLRNALRREKAHLLSLCHRSGDNPSHDNRPGDNPSCVDAISNRGNYTPPFVYPRSPFDTDKEIKSYDRADPQGDGIDCGLSHTARDLYFDGITWGTPVYAMKSGTVFVARNTGYPCSSELGCDDKAPNEVVIDEGNGWFTSYTHVYPKFTPADEGRRQLQKEN